MAAVIGRQRGKHLFVIKMSLRRNMVLVGHARTDPGRSLAPPSRSRMQRKPHAGCHRRAAVPGLLPP